MIHDTLIQHIKGTSFKYRGTARRGNVPRTFVSSGDEIRLTVYDERGVPVVVARSATGEIALDDEGNYRIALSASALDLSLDRDYRYLVTLNEGDTGDVFALRRGPLHITL